MSMLTVALLWLTPTNSFADEDKIMSRFTNSVATVYTSSEACKKAVAPGPEEYIKSITAYLKSFYPQEIYYWVLPPVRPLIKDNHQCAEILQKHLMEYAAAKRDYQDYYPDMPAPPALMAYNWRDTKNTSNPSRATGLLPGVILPPSTVRQPY